MKCNLSFLWVLVLTVFSSCVEEFVPLGLKKYEQLLVVDGAITDAPGPYTVKLSKSADLLEKTPSIPYSNCMVELADDAGNREVLSETAPGVYQTAPAGIQGVVGRKYKISISTPEGELYESAEETLKKGVGIKNVYGEYEHRNDPKLFFGRDGFQFYLDSEVPEADSNFFFWSMECTYKFTLEFNIDAYYDGTYVLKPFPKRDSLKTCYRTLRIPQITVLQANDKNPLRFSRIPLNYEDNYTKALKMRYSLNVTQYTIGEAAYTYWNNIKKITDSQGDLYSQQPYQVKNNLINRYDPNKPALGYFMAAGVSEKRIFAEPLWVKFRYPECKLNNPDRFLLRTLASSSADLWPIYITGGQWIDQDCVDCRRTGFLKKPDYWID